MSSELGPRLRKGRTRSATTRTPFARFVARIGVLLAALALLSQSFALAAAPRDARAAAAELSRALGASVILCTQVDDGSGAPAHENNGCDSCPLCRLAADASALPLPNNRALGPPTRIGGARLAPLPVAALHAPQPPPSPLPRGPPSLT